MTHALAVPDLWTSARNMLAQLFCVVGAGTAAALGALTRRQRGETLAWLAPLEALVRKLLLIEAAALARPLARPRQRGRRERAAESRKRAPAFALAPPEARVKPHPARITLFGPPATVVEIWRRRQRDASAKRLHGAARAAPNVRLANRIAALARAIARPLPHARRLARLLKRAVRAAFLAERIVAARLRRRSMMFDDRAFDAVSARAQTALPRVLNSS